MLIRIALLALVLLCPPAAGAQDLNEEFFAASRKGDVAALKALLDKGVDVNAKTRYGATALSYACDKGHVEVVRLLIERGADVNSKDTFYGEVPLGWALSHDHVHQGSGQSHRVHAEAIGGYVCVQANRKVVCSPAFRRKFVRSWLEDFCTHMFWRSASRSEIQTSA